MASVRRTVTLPLAFVACVLAVAGADCLRAPATQGSPAVEASLALDRSTGAARACARLLPAVRPVRAA